MRCRTTKRNTFKQLCITSCGSSALASASSPGRPGALVTLAQLSSSSLPIPRSHCPSPANLSARACLCWVGVGYSGRASASSCCCKFRLQAVPSAHCSRGSTRVVGAFRACLPCCSQACAVARPQRLHYSAGVAATADCSCSACCRRDGAAGSAQLQVQLQRSSSRSGGSKGASCGAHSCRCCLARSPLPTKESMWHATSTAAQQHTRQHAGFIVTGGLDGRVALWSNGGALVGMFGSHAWELEDASSWQTQHAAPLKVRTCTEHALLSNSILLAGVARSMHDRRVAPREACKCLLTTGKLRVHHCCTTTTASTTPRHRSASTCALLPGRQCHPVEQMPRLEPIHAAQAKRECAFRAQ